MEKFPVIFISYLKYIDIFNKVAKIIFLLY